MLHCAALDDYQDVTRKMGDWGRLAGKVELKAFTRHIDDRDALVRAIEDCAIVIAMRERTPFDRALIERLPNLKLLITTGMRNASIDLEAAVARGVTVCGTEAWGGTTAELTWGLILGLMRFIPEEAANLRKGGAWQTTVGRDVRGRRLGVVGMGNLGTRVARVGRAFDTPVSAWSRSLTAERAKALEVDYCAELDDLLRTSDIVTIHLVLNKETRGLIDARRLGLMKPEAVLINTARGPIVDEAALIEALETGKLAGAALDVYGEEPLPSDHPFRTLPNVWRRRISATSPSAPIRPITKAPSKTSRPGSPAARCACSPSPSERSLETLLSVGRPHVEGVDRHRDQRVIADARRRDRRARFAQHREPALIERVRQPPLTIERRDDVVDDGFVVMLEGRLAPGAHRVDHGVGHAGRTRVLLMCPPFIVRGPVARGQQDRELREARGQRAVITAILAERLGAFGQFGTAEPDGERTRHMPRGPATIMSWTRFCAGVSACRCRGREVAACRAPLRVSSMLRRQSSGHSRRAKFSD